MTFEEVMAAKHFQFTCLSWLNLHWRPFPATYQEWYLRDRKFNFPHFFFLSEPQPEVMHLEHHVALRDTEKLGARHNWQWGNSGINLEKNKPLWMVLFAAEPQATNCVHLKCTIDEESMCKREREGGREREGESEGDHTVNAQLLWQIRSASLSRSEQFFGSERHWRAAKKKI